MSDISDGLPTLDELGFLTGTDKNWFTGDYLRHYEPLFAPLRHAKFNLVEIGVFRGQSVDLWARYFSQAHIVGVDVNPECKRYGSDRVTIEIGDVENPELLARLARKFDPLVIIDDGSHRADHQIFVFERLFPALQPGGVYIVEDLHFHLQEPDATRLRGNSAISSVEYFTRLAEHSLRSRYQRQRLEGLNRYFADAMDSIQFIHQAIIVRKAPAEQESAEKLAALRPLVEQSGSFLNWLHFGLRLRDHGQLAGAIDAMQRSIAAKSDEIAPREWLSVMLERQGDIAGAIDAVEPLCKLMASNRDVVARIEKRIADIRKSHPS